MNDFLKTSYYRNIWDVLKEGNYITTFPAAEALIPVTPKY